MDDLIDGIPELRWEILKGVSFGSDSTNASAKFLWKKNTLYMYAVIEDKTWDKDDYIALIVGEKKENTVGTRAEAAVLLCRIYMTGDSSGSQDR